MRIITIIERLKNYFNGFHGQNLRSKRILWSLFWNIGAEILVKISYSWVAINNKGNIKRWIRSKAILAQYSQWHLLLFHPSRKGWPQEQERENRLCNISLMCYTTPFSLMLFRIIFIYFCAMEKHEKKPSCIPFTQKVHPGGMSKEYFLHCTRNFHLLSKHSASP